MVHKMQHKLAERQLGCHVGKVDEIQVVDRIFAVFDLMP